MGSAKKKNIGKYIKLAITAITIIISTRDNGQVLKKAIEEFKN